LSLESLVRVEGKLIERPSKDAGESGNLLELDIETLNILSKPKNLPFYSSHTKQLVRIMSTYKSQQTNLYIIAK
jgi:aspartyl-tRNA synthetase